MSFCQPSLRIFVLVAVLVLLDFHQAAFSGEKLDMFLVACLLFLELFFELHDAVVGFSLSKTMGFQTMSEVFAALHKLLFRSCLLGNTDLELLDFLFEGLCVGGIEINASDGVRDEGMVLLGKVAQLE